MKTAAIIFSALIVCAVIAAQDAPTPTPIGSETQHPLPLKVGGTVTPPRVRDSPDPKLAKGVKAKGMVILGCVVGTDGRAHDLRIVKSLTPEADQAAIEAVKEWRFEPAKNNGIPVAVKINIEVNFR